MRIVFALFALGMMATLTALAEHPKPLSCAADCAACTYGPHIDKVKHAKYGSKEETFCLRKLPCFGWLFHGDPCPECEPPRTKNRLVKWEVVEEKVKMKCTPPSNATPMATTPVLPIVIPPASPR